MATARKTSPISCIVGCYQLHLYCINQCDDLYLPVEYTEVNGARCRAEARKDGWIIRVKDNYALCPKCRKRRDAPLTARKEKEGDS